MQSGGTDGVCEMRDATGRPFGMDRLHDVIREFAGKTAAKITAAVRDRLTLFRCDAK